MFEHVLSSTYRTEKFPTKIVGALVRCCVLEICAILYTCEGLCARDLRHFVNWYLFAVSIYIGATSVGCLLSGIMMDLWGRRLAVQIAVACICISWLLTAISTTYPLMLVGRALCGFGKGVSTPGITVSKKQS
jgi:MFS family permease